MTLMTLEQIQSGQVFLVDKPLDWTSFQVVNKMKFKLKKEFKLKKIKIGHAGTLDNRTACCLYRKSNQENSRNTRCSERVLGRDKDWSSDRIL